MLRLQNTMQVPQGYWRFPRHYPAEDGQFIKSGDFPGLVQAVYEYRVMNRMELGDPDAEIQDWICRNSGAPCAPVKPKDMQPTRNAKGIDVARFLGAMVEWVKSDEIVPQEEAERRAEICAGCRWNVQIEDAGCLGCFGLTARIMRIIGARKTRMDHVLKFCGVCGCSTQVQAFVPMDVLNRAHRGLDFPEDTGQPGIECWKRNTK